MATPGIVNRDGVVAATAMPTSMVVNKATIANMATGGFASLWRATNWPVQGVLPTAAAICTGATVGSLGQIPTPGVGQRSAIIKLALASASQGPLVQVVDRLGHMGGLVANITTPQAVGLSVASLVGTRVPAGYTSVRWWVEIYADIGTTAATLTVNYVDANGDARTTTLPIGGASPANRAGRIFQIIPQAATPLPIESITQVTLNTTTGVAGNFGITADVVLVDVACPMLAQGAVAYDYAGTAAPTVHADACLAFTQLCTTTSTGQLVGSVRAGTA